MKVVFVGPSLPDARSFADGRIEVRPPAIQGDVLKAVSDGATAIGLIDGGFEYTAPVWHKEILYALSQNIRILGAASMGALRAVECKPFGMIGVGRIFRDYDTAVTIDDADVALLHGPAELGFKPLTLPLVNVRATLDSMEDRLCPELRVDLEKTAAEIFFKERTWRAVVDALDKKYAPGSRQLLQLLTQCQIDQKRQDALSLMEALLALPDELNRDVCSWTVNASFAFRSYD